MIVDYVPNTTAARTAQASAIIADERSWISAAPDEPVWLGVADAVVLLAYEEVELTCEVANAVGTGGVYIAVEVVTMVAFVRGAVVWIAFAERLLTAAENVALLTGVVMLK